jgi:hypothetical protein
MPGELKIIYPDSKALNNPEAIERIIETQNTYIFEEVEYPEEGGILIKYQGIPYKKKGLPYPEAIWSVNSVKRITLLLMYSIGFYKFFSKKSIEKIMAAYVRECDMILEKCMLKDEFFCKSAKELLKGLQIFFTTLGFKEDLSYRISRIIAMMLEYDNAYRYRFQDLASETSSTELFMNPVKELKRLIRIAFNRDNKGIASKTTKLIKLVTLILIVPKIRKAFRYAVFGVKFQNLQFDEDDRYFCLNRSDYNFFGKSLEERLKEYNKIHNNNLPPMMEIKAQ